MTEASTPADAAANQPALPLFYKNPQPLDPSRHAKAGLRERSDFAFAQGTNAILLLCSEFGLAARHYPIVFSAVAPVLPFVAVGLRDNENVFVGAQGDWREDTYIPGYVRRYPFIFSEITGSDRLLLCVDEAADNYETESQHPFFVDSKPSAGLERIMKFSEAYQADFNETLRFGKWLEENNLLEDRVMRAKLGDGGEFTLRGFRQVTVEKARVLTDAQILEMHKNGWLPLLHFHLQSMSNWDLVGKLTQGRQAAA